MPAHLIQAGDAGLVKSGRIVCSGCRRMSDHHVRPRPDRDFLKQRHATHPPARSGDHPAHEREGRRGKREEDGYFHGWLPEFVVAWPRIATQRAPTCEAAHTTKSLCLAVSIHAGRVPRAAWRGRGVAAGPPCSDSSPHRRLRGGLSADSPAGARDSRRCRVLAGVSIFNAERQVCNDALGNVSNAFPAVGLSSASTFHSRFFNDLWRP